MSAERVFTRPGPGLRVPPAPSWSASGSSEADPLSFVPQGAWTPRGESPRVVRMKIVA